MNQKTEIREFIQVLKKKIWLIVTITLTFIFLAWIKIFFFTTPVYEAQTTIMINNLAGRESKVTEGDIKYSQLIGDTYRPILQSRRVALEIKKNLNLKKHYVIKSVHPSPLSSYRGFFGSRPFSQTNEFLKSKKIKPIDWTLG